MLDRSTGYVKWIWTMKSLPNSLTGKYEWKTTFCRPRHRWEYNCVKIDLKKQLCRVQFDERDCEHYETSWCVEKLGRWHTRNVTADGNFDRLWCFRIWTSIPCMTSQFVLCVWNLDPYQRSLFPVLNLHFIVKHSFPIWCSTALYHSDLALTLHVQQYACSYTLHTNKYKTAQLQIFHCNIFAVTHNATVKISLFRI
jgi:hypothetical protein